MIGPSQPLMTDLGPTATSDPSQGASPGASGVPDEPKPTKSPAHGSGQDVYGSLGSQTPGRTQNDATQTATTKRPLVPFLNDPTTLIAQTGPVSEHHQRTTTHLRICLTKIQHQDLTATCPDLLRVLLWELMEH